MNKLPSPMPHPENFLLANIGHAIYVATPKLSIQGKMFACVQPAHQLKILECYNDLNEYVQ